MCLQEAKRHDLAMILNVGSIIVAVIVQVLTYHRTASELTVSYVEIGCYRFFIVVDISIFDITAFTSITVLF